MGYKVRAFCDCDCARDDEGSSIVITREIVEGAGMRNSVIICNYNLGVNKEENSTVKEREDRTWRVGHVRRVLRVRR